MAATGEQAKREQSVLTDVFFNSSDALADEQRELESSMLKARVDGELSPEEQAKITAQLGATQEALAAYIRRATRSRIWRRTSSHRGRDRRSICTAEPAPASARR